MTKLAMFSRNGSPSLGAVVDDGIVDLTERLGGGHTTIRSVFEKESMDDIRMASSGPADHSIDEVEFLPPVLGAEKIICVGINYPARDAEYADSRPNSSYPNLFVRFGRSFSGHNQPIVRPRASEQLDYEGEIVLVIGRSGRHVRAADALSLIGGVTAGNEGTLRDWVQHGSRNVTQGKNFDRSGSLGPWVVPADEIALDNPITVETRVNGEVRQHDTSDRLLFGFGELIDYITTFTTLEPGDVIFTGTPTGSGSHAKPPVWLVPGDVLEVEVEGVGILRNTIIDEE